MPRVHQSTVFDLEKRSKGLFCLAFAPAQVMANDEATARQRAVTMPTPSRIGH
jgi:hypothetical protein